MSFEARWTGKGWHVTESPLMGTMIRGWIDIPVTPEMLARAHEIRSERSGLPHLFETPGGEPVWGDLGEVVVDHWLSGLGIDYQWEMDNPLGNPDFFIGGSTVDVKTVKRTVAVKPGYGAQVSVPHAQKLIGWFFFCSYNTTKKIMTLIGAITRTDLRSDAHLYGPGERVTDNYVVPPGNSIYNVYVENLIPPDEWLRILVP